MKKISLLLLSTTIISSPTFAEDSPQGITKSVNFSANIGYFSDYVFRGITQTNKNFALQGGFDAQHESGAYLGTWASNVDFDDGDQASAEVDIYGGYNFNFKSFNIDLGAIYYAYPDASSDLDYDFYEIYAGASTEIGKLGLGTSVNYTPENFGSSGNATYFAATAEYALVDKLKLKTDIGYQMIDDAAAFGTDDYLHWGIGLGYTYEGFDLLLKYSQSDLDNPGTTCGDSCDPKIIVGVSRSF